MISQELELQGSGTKAPVLAPKGPRLPGKEARGRASAQKGRPLPAASEQGGAGTAAPARGVARSALLPSLGRDPRTHHPIHRRSHGVRFQKRTPWGSETLDLGRKEVGTPGARTDRPHRAPGPKEGGAAPHQGRSGAAAQDLRRVKILQMHPCAWVTCVPVTTLKNLQTVNVGES